MFNLWLGKKRGYLTDWITQRWVQLTGIKIDLRNEKWLLGPIGDTEIIGEHFYKTLAEKEDLEIVINAPGSGLLKYINVFKNDSPYEINLKVKDFYEHAIDFGFDVWSKWCGLFKPFGWMLYVIFSKRLQQLNVPLSSLDTAHGVTSDIIQLKDKTTGETAYTVWLRKKIESKDIIYSGCYTYCKPPNTDYNCIKVVFPLPNGSATVIMIPVIGSDGSLKLVSSGSKAGDPGFYFIIKKSDSVYYIKFLKTMRETIHVYEDSSGILRTDHVLTVWKRTFLKLHYKIFSRT
jgi:hypothetical protein